MTAPPMLSVGPTDRPAIKDMSAEWRAFMGIPSGDAISQDYSGLQNYAQAPADEAWVFACIKRLYMDAQGVPLRVWIKEGNGERRMLQPDDDERALALQYLLDNCNDTSMSGADFRAYHVASMATWGMDYWTKVRGRLGGPPKELYWLPAPSVKVDVRPGEAWISSYTWTPKSGGQGKTYQPGDIIASRTINLVDPTVGLSPIQAIRNNILVNRQATTMAAYTLANWGIPAGAWIAPKGSELQPQDQSAIQRALKWLRGPKNRGKVPILPEGLEWKQLALSSQDAEWLAGQKASRMTICAAFGVPLVLVGDDEKTSVYAAIRDAERVYWRGTQIPGLDKFADTLNNWLLPDFGKDTRLWMEIGFDYTKIEALQAPLEDQKKVSILEMDRSALTPNGYRKRYGLGEPYPWGDVPVLSTRVQIDPLTGQPIGGPGQPFQVSTKPEADQLDKVPVPLLAEPVIPESQVNPAEAVRALTGLYRHPAVLAFRAGKALDVTALIGQPVSPGFAAALGVGLQRRYSPTQLVDGVPGESFLGLKEYDA